MVQDGIAEIQPLVGRSTVSLGGEQTAARPASTIGVTLSVRGGNIFCWSCERALEEPKLIASDPFVLVQEQDHIASRFWVSMLCPLCQTELLRFQSEANYAYR